MEGNGEDKPKVFLNEEDLKGFMIRRGALENADTVFVLMRDGFKVWADGIRARYSITDAFDVDLRTGEIKERKPVERESDDG